jgi:hypothetical protein
MRTQEEPRGARRSQDEPGGARRSQEMLCSGGMDDRRGLRPRLLFTTTTTTGGKGSGPGKRNWMMCSGRMDDRRGLRPRLLFKTTPGGKEAGPRRRNWMLCSGGMDDRRGLWPRLFFKTTTGGKSSGPGKRNWMLCSGGMDDRRGLRPSLLSKQLQAGRGSAQGEGTGCCVLAELMTDGAFGPVCFSKQLQAGREPAQGEGIGCPRPHETSAVVASRNFRDTLNSQCKTVKIGSSFTKGRGATLQPRSERGQGKRKSCLAGSYPPSRSTTPCQTISREEHVDCPRPHGTSAFVASRHLRNTSVPHLKSAAVGRDCKVRRVARQLFVRAPGRAGGRPLRTHTARLRGLAAS